jgi:NACHT C-terminal Alpha/Beta 2
VQVLAARAQTDIPRRIGLMADLLACHGGNIGDSKQPIGPAHRAALRVILEGWIAILRAAPNPEQYACSEVARAAERLADASLAESLRLLLERDLTAYAAARTAQQRAAQLETTATAATHHALQYARAFASMHDAPAVAVLMRGLSDLRWGVDAAGALHEIWYVDHPPKESPTFGSWTDFSQHLSRRAERAPGTPSTSEFAEAIFAVVHTFGDATRSDAEQQHALALAVTGLGLPHGAKRCVIDSLLALPQPITLKYRLLAAAARAGEVIPVTLLMAGLGNLLAAARTEAWRLNENRGELMGWIDLFPFSDGPKMVHEAIRLLPEPHRQPHSLRRLLETLPQSPASSALASLERLATDDPAFWQEFEWVNALIKLDTEAAAMTVLDGLCAGRIPPGDGFRLSTALAGWGRKYRTVRAEIITRYRTLPAGHIRGVFEMAMDDLTDEEVFMALFDGHVDEPHHNFGVVASALRNLAIGRKPSDEWAGAVEEFGLPLTELRARLFAMLPANDGRAWLAKQCLIAIEEHRDHRGRVSNEPRHPDIGTGRAWPTEADEPTGLAI